MGARSAGFTRKGKLLLLLAALLATAAAQTPAPITDLKPTVLLISVDGFRWDYLDRHQPPNLSALAKGGVRAKWMIPSFPTKTFPNHYSIVTGLYPDHHGIVANSMWDDEMSKKFAMSMRAEVQNAKWWGGEPIWVTAEKAGVRTAPLYWPGSEAAIEGIRPTYWEAFDEDHSQPHEYRLQRFFTWIDLPVTHRPQFLSLYFEDVDSAGHDHGPDSPELAAAVSKVDKTIGELMAGLRERGIADKINLIIVSDHGMAPSPHKLFLEEYLDIASVNLVDWSPVLAIDQKNGNLEAVLARLKKVPHLSVYRKSELPARWHYGKHPRVPDIIAVADEGWEITTRKRLANRKRGPEVATHGYDNELPSMRATFLAHGPAFVSGKVIGPFANINVYALMCKLLGLQPAPNDGSLAPFAKALRR